MTIGVRGHLTMYTLIIDNVDQLAHLNDIVHQFFSIVVDHRAPDQANNRMQKVYLLYIVIVVLAVRRRVRVRVRVGVKVIVIDADIQLQL